jgi:hypothetical protein
MMPLAWIRRNRRVFPEVTRLKGLYRAREFRVFRGNPKSQLRIGNREPGSFEIPPVVGMTGSSLKTQRIIPSSGQRLRAVTSFRGTT